VGHPTEDVLFLPVPRPQFFAKQLELSLLTTQNRHFPQELLLGPTSVCHAAPLMLCHVAPSETWGPGQTNLVEVLDNTIGRFRNS
jgi:hypothetical protein